MYGGIVSVLESRGTKKHFNIIFPTMSNPNCTLSFKLSSPIQLHTYSLNMPVFNEWCAKEMTTIKKKDRVTEAKR